MIAADDANSTLDERKERNLNFRSEIWEAYAAAEFNFFEFEPGTKLNHTPYINAGFGIFSFNPEANYNGDWIALRPLRTEGQGTSLGSGSPYATASSYFIFSLGYELHIFGKAFPNFNLMPAAWLSDRFPILYNIRATNRLAVLFSLFISYIYKY